MRVSSRLARVSGTVLPLALLAGCAPGTVTSAPSSHVLANVSGNWFFGVSDPVQPVTVSSFSGSLNSSGSQVTGTFHAVDSTRSPCVSSALDLPVTGTIDSSNRLTLSFPISGGTATLTTTTGGSYPVPGSSILISGGLCAENEAAMAGAVPSVSGTYTGVLTPGGSTGAAPTTATLTLAEASLPGADGFFPLSGTLTLSGSCSGTVSFANGSLSGLLINVIQANAIQSTGGSLTGSSAWNSAMIEPVQATLGTAPGCMDLIGNLVRQ